MNNDQAIKTLLKIAQKQQKMIEKLAQLNNQQLSPQHLEPINPELHPEQVVMAALHPSVKNTIQDIMAKGNVLEVSFRPGKASQQSLDYITKVVQHLVSTNKLPFAYSVSATA